MYLQLKQGIYTERMRYHLKSPRYAKGIIKYNGKICCFPLFPSTTTVYRVSWGAARLFLHFLEPEAVAEEPLVEPLEASVEEEPLEDVEPVLLDEVVVEDDDDAPLRMMLVAFSAATMMMACELPVGRSGWMEPSTT